MAQAQAAAPRRRPAGRPGARGAERCRHAAALVADCTAATHCPVLLMMMVPALPAATWPSHGPAAVALPFSSAPGNLSLGAPTTTRVPLDSPGQRQATPSKMAQRGIRPVCVCVCVSSGQGGGEIDGDILCYVELGAILPPPILPLSRLSASAFQRGGGTCLSSHTHAPTQAHIHGSGIRGLLRTTPSRL